MSSFASVSEALEILGVSRSCLLRAIDAGQIPSTKLGKRRLIPRAWLDEFERQALATAVPAGVR